MLRRRRPSRRQKASVQYLDTGPDEPTKWVVQGRFGGACARCGHPGATIQHRKPRRMGGTRDPAINRPSNLIWVCGTGTTGCHGHMESYRHEAYGAGWLLHDGEDPLLEPVLLWDRRRVVLDDEGGYELAPKEEETQ